jgi:hypothetical protein
VRLVWILRLYPAAVKTLGRVFFCPQVNLAALRAIQRVANVVPFVLK